ncbi:TIGR03503 family protein [Enterovibrio norvegicus]|uniref:TIGR03503 family protein n=1 Tax=Enterovibrio norvegicus TaxID=188144 RepID=UPI000C854702|nr:TIGR03503 family protein [Enterovibrio norvegicus]MCC4799034.1 TIGR03503 family protein [Enterovibrio norvegicus]PMI29328.1 TIGR03503 family protein [Enterovibrio norvegicus]PMI37893.1 TIGR03503 family protein [Enterovibrio norvegicus]PMN46482.1 TIGR03503 family protein [Enterovibrio norvegicus]TKF10971.1 TIGR03503 family protein [Enterovibrio norvegicus]
MKRGWAGLLLVLLMSFNVSAAQTSDRDIRLLNNRFRIDSTITQVAFVIYREEASRPVVLIQPDGTKLYEWRHPDNVSWHTEADMDIVSVFNPMPGPWQAIGKVTPENKIRILSELSMKVDTFPDRLYQGETLKFTAQLMQAGSPLNLRDFLDSVELGVTFTEFIESVEGIPVDQRPQAKSLGQFKDDGAGLDEVAGDGMFTVELPINVPPGKYRARVTSGNGVFFRTLEQEVLVYPTPLMATFKQSRKKALPHHFLVESDTASVEPGTIATHVEFTDSNGKPSVYQGQATKDYTRLTVDIDNFDVPGRHKWHAWLYGTDKLSSRPLVFELPEQTFAVADYEAIEQAKLEREAREEERARIEEERLAAIQREEDRKMALITIIGGNILLLVLAILTWFIIRKIKAKKLAAEMEGELEAPPEESDKAS